MTLIHDVITADGNSIRILAMDDQPMNFLVRVNGNIRTIRGAVREMGREAQRAARGPMVG